MAGFTIGADRTESRAWCNCNGDEFGIRDSYNISGFVDRATGRYTFNFATNMGNTLYSFTGSSNGTSGNSYAGAWAGSPRCSVAINNPTTSSMNIDQHNDTNYYDLDLVCMQVHGN